MNDIVTIKSTSEIIPLLKEYKLTDEYMNEIQKEVDRFIQVSKSTIVTEETLAENKKYVAELNKKIASLRTFKTQAKQVILSQLNILNEQIDYLVDKITEADTIVRNQNKYIDEQRKNNLENEVLKEYTSYCEEYDFNIFDFDTFKRYYPIKISMTINKYKLAIIEFIERTKNEVEILKLLTSDEKFLEMYKEYVLNGRLNVALSTTKHLIEGSKKEKEEIKEQVTAEIKEQIKQENFIIKLTNADDYKRVITYLKKYNINFKENL